MSISHISIGIKEGVNIKDKLSIPHRHNNGSVSGKVIATIHGTNKVLFEEWNKVIIPGSIYTACKHFPNIVPETKTPTYNSIIGLDNTVSLTRTEENASQVCLFALGVDGCGPEHSQVYDVDYTKWIRPNDLVPFRYQLMDNDLSETLREKYFGRKAITGNNRIAYYFKGFDLDAVLHTEYIDGTPIDDNIYQSDNTMEANTYVELKLSITKEDCREYFEATSGINQAKVNTISLLTAYPKLVNGYTYYQNIRPLTKLNFPNISLIDKTLGVDITYQIYY